MAKIGLFLIYKNIIIGKKRDISEGKEVAPHILQCPDSFDDIWLRDEKTICLFPELGKINYQVIPRGRVIYSLNDEQAVIYMDLDLHKKPIKKLISDFFELDNNTKFWKIDMEYTHLRRQLLSKSIKRAAVQEKSGQTNK